MLRLTPLLALSAALIGCEIKKPEPLRCANSMCVDAGEVGGLCTRNMECSGDTPACDTAQKICVECFGDTHDRCTGTKPRCEHDTCVACVDDGDCNNTGVCLPTGDCADPRRIIHAASPNGSTANGCGDLTNPCTFDKALAIATADKVIKLDNAGPYIPTGKSFVVDTDVTIDMRKATLHPHTGMDGPLLDVKNKTVVILEGTIEGTSNGDGIACAGTLTIDGTIITMADRSGISAVAGCKLTVTHATITNTSMKNPLVAAIVDNGDSITVSRSSLMANRGGGIAINNGTFLLVSNAIMNNGTHNLDGSGSATGGISITPPQDNSNRLYFNTVSQNTIQNGTRSSGIDCNSGTNTISFYNIVWNNQFTPIQITGGCKHAYSDVGPLSIATTPVDGGSNANFEPQLMDELSNPHLRMTSPAIGYADQSVDLGTIAGGIAIEDIDGDPRVKRTGMGVDIGADQFSAKPGAR
jgi:hypothetical protein